MKNILKKVNLKVIVFILVILAIWIYNLTMIARCSADVGNRLRELERAVAECPCVASEVVGDE